MFRLWGSSIYLSSYKYLNCKTVMGDDAKVVPTKYSSLINISALISLVFHWLIIVLAYTWVCCAQGSICAGHSVVQHLQSIELLNLQGQPASHEMGSFSFQRPSLNFQQSHTVFGVCRVTILLSSICPETRTGQKRENIIIYFTNLKVNRTEQIVYCCCC